MIRIDRYTDAWAIGIVEDLEAGTPPAEAVAGAVSALNHQADEAESKAEDRAKRAAMFERIGNAYLGAESSAAQHRRAEREHRDHAERLRETAKAAATLKGEVIPIAGLLR